MSNDEIELIFDGSEEPLLVSKAVLTLSSPVFKQMLDHDMVEKNSRSIQLLGKDREEFEVFLSFLMPVSGREQHVTVQNVDFLLPLSNEYCIDLIKQECIEIVKQQPPSVERLLQAYTYGIDDYLKECTIALIKGGEKNWDLCMDNPELMCIVFRHSLEVPAQVKLETEASTGEEITESFYDTLLREAQSRSIGRSRRTKKNKNKKDT